MKENECCPSCLKCENMSKNSDCKSQLDIQLLEAKLYELEFEKGKVEDQCRLLSKRNGELEEEIKKIVNEKIVGSNGEKEKGDMVDLFGDEEDEVLRLMIENKVLECEKRKAESEVEEWKVKFMRLQSRVDELEKSFASGIKECVLSGTKEIEETGGSPSARTPLEEVVYGDRRKPSTPLKHEIQNKFRIRKRLAFPQDESPSKKMAPSTPHGMKHAVVDVIDIDDSDDEKKSTLDHSAPSTVLCNNDCSEENLSFKPTLRRKSSCNVVTSDAESDDDDDVPLSRLITNRNKEKEALDEVGEPAERPRLRRLRKCKERKYPGVPTDDVEDEDSSHSEGDSLNGFIVNSSDSSDSEEISNSVDATERDDSSEDESDEKLDYKEIISQIRRTRNHKAKWEFEADMLADFGKNPELCMRAVCALYRQQTAAERIAKGSFVTNGRGFNQCDAFRGSKLAEFLTNEQGELQKSVEELLKYDPKGPERCRELACRYSKQLFEIYVNQEDPLFLPP